LAPGNFARFLDAAGEAPEEGVNAAIASIRARFGRRAIGLGYGGICYLVNALR
jgi:hypothetical protein